MADSFKAILLTQEDDETKFEIKEMTDDDLPDGDVLVDVKYSSLNYKDALAVTGSGPIVRSWPMVPGIDLVGTVEESQSDDYQPGDEVILTGWGIGEQHWGGFTQKQRVQSDWLVPMPKGLDAQKAMTIGTAGFTATLCVMTLEEADVTPDKGPVLVTGATGGVGSIATAMLSQLGYEVAALIGPDESEEEVGDYLRSLGAAEIVGGSEWQDEPRPLDSQRWAGAVDTVGTNVLARVLSQVNYGGAVANCGNAGGNDLKTTVMPFILRAVSLRGVESVQVPFQRRKRAWERLVEDLPENALEQIHSGVISLDDVQEHAQTMIQGEGRGRLVVDPNG